MHVALSALALLVLSPLAMAAFLLVNVDLCLVMLLFTSSPFSPGAAQQEETQNRLLVAPSAEGVKGKLNGCWLLP